jgi:hypothetical protein
MQPARRRRAGCGHIGFVYLPTTLAKEFSIPSRRVITIDPTISTRSRFAGRMVYLGRNCITQRTVE